MNINSIPGYVFNKIREVTSLDEETIRQVISALQDIHRAEVEKAQQRLLADTARSKLSNHERDALTAQISAGAKAEFEIVTSELLAVAEQLVRECDDCGGFSPDQAVSGMTYDMAVRAIAKAKGESSE